MRRENPSQAGYYREQALRVRKRAELALTREQRESLLELAQRWEKLAIGDETMVEAMPGIGEAQIRQEAKMFAKRFPANPAAEAAQYASRAYKAGDMVNFELWTRIAKVILEMDRKPSRGRRLH
ncbi:MAG TPA: hypothetical protein VH189_11235 [Rhizomicrobium sp.]|nr:hypothetical protein [Rhizomicrobium sp.]